MMLKSKSSQSKRSGWTLLRAGLAGLAVAIGGAALTAGCLDRPVAPAVPRTSNIYVDEIRQTAVDKIDLLFMIDNSISMADKQAILADAVPLLVQRLITPICVRPCAKADHCTPAQEKDGIPTTGNADANGQCAQGAPEFNPIKDIHVGVITSSLGSHGAAGAKDVCVSTEDNDHAHLLGSIRPNNMPPLQPYDGNGFLKWDVTKPAKYTPAGESNGATFTTKFTEMVKSSGEHGCGYEASLEAWYRFLIDPEPPGTVAVGADSKSTVQDVDATVLAQRAAFLRPDSLVAIVMLTDENDCSIVDEGYGWLIARAAPMYRSTSQCAANPNDKCCQSCAETKENPGCPAIGSDAECAKAQTLPAADDDLNLRCWQQKRRFGFELLYPTTRYSEGLRSPLVERRSDRTLVGNPLFAASDGKTPRDKGLVFLAGIVGVPWQDLADDDSLPANAGLRYLTASELAAKDRWAMILGSPNANTNDPPVPPTDPLMIGQLQVINVTNLEEAKLKLYEHKRELLAEADSIDPILKKFGGGARDLEVRTIASSPIGGFLVVHLIYDVRDAMGANAVNTACERLAPRVEAITSGNYWPAWRDDSTFPKKIEDGKRYCYFLRRIETGFVVLRGVNGAYEVDGSQLVFPGREKKAGLTVDEIRKIVDEP